MEIMICCILVIACILCASSDSEDKKPKRKKTEKEIFIESNAERVAKHMIRMLFR